MYFPILARHLVQIVGQIDKHTKFITVQLSHNCSITHLAFSNYTGLPIVMRDTGNAWHCTGCQSAYFVNGAIRKLDLKITGSVS